MMTPTCWMDWCNRQAAELSRKLIIQGYDPASIEHFRATDREFDQRFTSFEQAFDQIAEAMVANPAGYHHYESLGKAQRDLLEYTCSVRGQLLDNPLARTA